MPDLGAGVERVVAGLGCRGIGLIHCGGHMSLTKAQRKASMCRSAMESMIGHLKKDHGMRRCWLKRSKDDAIHAVPCVGASNIASLLRAIARPGAGTLCVCLLSVAIVRRQAREPSVPSAPRAIRGVKN